MRVLEHLEPKEVFYFFEEICKIPHGSGNLDAISSYLENFAKERNLFYIRDASNNVIMIKEATSGYEMVEPIMLQGHMDMVAVKKNGCDIDLEKDPLRLKVDGDFVYAQDTSLGGDDGIAVAYILAILDSDKIAHPRIEAVITTDEEVGMNGATAIDLSMLKAKRMLNIDSEEEGILLTSCAGGVRVDCHLPIKEIPQQPDMAYMEITVGGLLGGHSGTEIDKGHGNAIKLLGIILKQALEKYTFHIAQINGGEKDNAIPRDASATICIKQEKSKDFIEEIARIESELKNEYKSKEKNLYIKVQPLTSYQFPTFDAESTRRTIDFLVLLPNGVMAMSADITGLVETSLNAGILKQAENEVILSSSIRSAIESAKHKIVLQVETLTKLFGGYVETHGDYPGWQFKPDSKLRASMVQIYRELFGKEAQIQALHAGLECGIMAAKISGLDCVSFGPNIYDIHTTEERLSISSTYRTWNYLLEILKQKQ